MNSDSFYYKKGRFARAGDYFTVSERNAWTKRAPAVRSSGALGALSPGGQRLYITFHKYVCISERNPESELINSLPIKQCWRAWCPGVTRNAVHTVRPQSKRRRPVGQTSSGAPRSAHHLVNSFWHKLELN